EKMPHDGGAWFWSDPLARLEHLIAAGELNGWKCSFSKIVVPFGENKVGELCVLGEFAVIERDPSNAVQQAKAGGAQFANAQQEGHDPWTASKNCVNVRMLGDLGETLEKSIEQLWIAFQ